MRKNSYNSNPNSDLNQNLNGEESMHNNNSRQLSSHDFGPEPLVININNATLHNNYFRNALWTGEHLQITLMSIRPGEDIGIEMHPNVDQFLRVERGQGLVMMGKNRDNLNYMKRVYDDFAIVVPAGTWHNIINTGRVPLKLYSIYAPPNHTHGTVHVTKEDAEYQEEHHH